MQKLLQIYYNSLIKQFQKVYIQCAHHHQADSNDVVAAATDMVVVLQKEDVMTVCLSAGYMIMITNIYSKVAVEEATAAAVAVVAEEAEVMEVVDPVTVVAVPAMAAVEALEAVAPTAAAVADPIVNSKCCFNIMTLLPLSFPVDL